ncbi:hypothetical cyanophage protein [Synechococcus phage S-CRM01]|uniref:hypothetical cyanophage protein n=1 Tax=Synechococcus phage S-CRM01 TaxID=1026955 RepID=UPI000209E367|nr:hypothetical cyanophage protein [Synechococcus phage S-CRM01]AEC53008.1 hypothetical cyanophage protein [Synechococcus phage S-CRM01]
MASSVLSGILKVDVNTKKSIQSIDATLEKIYKLEIDKNKRDIREKKATEQANKTKEKERNILDDILKELKGKKKEEKKESFLAGLLKNIGPAITAAGPVIGKAFAGLLAAGGALGAVITKGMGALFKVGGPIFAVVASALVGWKLGEWLNKNIIDKQVKPWLERQGNKVNKFTDKATGGGQSRNVSTLEATKLIKEKRSAMMGNPMWGVPALQGIAKENTQKDIDALTEIVHSIRDRKRLNDLLYDARQEGKQQKIDELTKEIKEKEDKIDRLVSSRPGLLQELGVQKKQRGGPITVPGTGSGDKIPMMLPPGSFVMNRNASAMLQSGGLVPTLLEPGEKVFAPGDVSPMHHMLNSMIPRFQTGGEVTKQNTAKETVVTKGKDKASSGGGLPAVVAAGIELIKKGFTVGEHKNFIKGPPSKYSPEGKGRVGGHSPNSLHYSGRAIDVTDWRNGDWRGRTRKLAEEVFSNRERLKLTQIIHDPWGSWFAGESKKGGPIGGHGEHLHLGFAKGTGLDLGTWGIGNKENNPSAPSDGTPQDPQSTIAGEFSGLGEVGKAITSVFAGFGNAMGPNAGPLFNAMFGLSSGSSTPSPSTENNNNSGGGGSVAVGGPFDKNLAKLLKNYEGLRTSAYKDAVGIPTIGIGATYYPKGFRLSGKVQMGQKITETEAEFIKEQHIKEHRGRLLREISSSEYSKVPDNVKAALESKTFNYGSLGGPLSKLVKQGVQSKEYGPVSGYFRSTLAKHDGGLNSWRRNDEANIIDTGKSKRANVAFSKNATMLQTGGLVNMSPTQSNNTTRFKQAQEEFAQMIAEKSGGPIIVMAGGNQQSPTVIPAPASQPAPPSLPDGPSSIQAAEYFYRLNMGSVI